MSDERKKSKSSKSSKNDRKSKSERKSKATPKRMSRVVRQKMITKRAFLKFAKTQRGKVVESLTEEKRESIGKGPRRFFLFKNQFSLIGGAKSSTPKIAD